MHSSFANNPEDVGPDAYDTLDVLSVLPPALPSFRESNYDEGSGAAEPCYLRGKICTLPPEPNAVRDEIIVINPVAGDGQGRLAVSVTGFPCRVCAECHTQYIDLTPKAELEQLLSTRVQQQVPLLTIAYQQLMADAALST